MLSTFSPLYYPASSLAVSISIFSVLFLLFAALLTLCFYNTFLLHDTAYGVSKLFEIETIYLKGLVGADNPDHSAFLKS